MKAVNIDSSKRFDRPCLSRRLFFSLLNKLQHGYLELNDGGNRYHFGDNKADIRAQVTITDPRAYRRILFGGGIGAAEAYVEGLWYADNLTQVIQLFSRNLNAFKQYEKRFSFLTQTINTVKHYLNKNSKSGSRTNIAAHYDISNEMYQLFLDPHMQYSSAIFPSPETSLEQAQEHKMDRICRYLELSENDHLLEVGTGWGGLACYAAKHYGCQVTTTTISSAQYEIAKQRIEDQGLTDKVTLLLEDYRDLTGQYSKIVSIEMIEAVGHQYMPSYFKMLENRLIAGGKLLIQAITMNDQRYTAYRKRVDFIQKYIFPGGHLPSVSMLGEHIKQHTSMYIDDLKDYREDYANTLEIWRNRFLQNRSEITRLDFNEDFIRLWEFYFSYCEGGFREQAIGLAQIGLVKKAR